MSATVPGGSTLELNADAIREALDGGESINKLAERYGCARSTMQSFVRSLSEQPSQDDRGLIDEAHERLRAAAAEDGAIPGQQTIDGREVPPQEVFPEEIRVDGTAQLAAFDMGGKRPQSSSLRLTGGRVGLLDGKAYRKGDVIHFEGTAVVREVAQRDKPDPQTGIVVSAEQKHIAEIVDLTVKQ